MASIDFNWTPKQHDLMSQIQQERIKISCDVTTQQKQNLMIKLM